MFLLAETGNRHLNGAMLEALVPLLDGTREPEDLMRQLSPDFHASEVFRALVELRDAGYLTDETTPPTAHDVYWEELGGTRQEATQRLAAATVDVRAIGCGNQSDLTAAAMKKHGLRVTQDGDTLVVLTDDYLNPALGRIDAACRQENRSWVLARLVGATAWMGPLFTPGETACWFCLEHRLRGNRPIEDMIRLKTESASPPAVTRGTIPPTLDAAVALLVARIVAWLGTGDPSHFAGVITSVNVSTAQVETHRLDRRPQCPECGDPTLYTRQLANPLELESQSAVVTADGGYRAVDTETTVSRFEALVSPITGVVRDVKPVTLGRESPVRLYVASHAGPALSHPRAVFYGVAGEAGAGGKGLTDLQARASALGEAIERASGVFQGDEVCLHASYDKLRDRAIHPNECMLFSEAQYRAADEGLTRKGGMNAVPFRFDTTVEMDWTPVWSMTEGRRRYLPTQYLYFAHPGPVEHTFSFADSNGNAAGNTLEEAVLQGLFEVVERDAVCLWWYNRLRMPALDLSAVAEPRVRALLTYYESLGREVTALDLTSDLGIPVYAAVSRVVSGGPEQILVGFGAHLDPMIALGRAVTEMNQVLAILDRLDASRGRIPPHLDTWLASARLEDHLYLAPGEGRAVTLREVAAGSDILESVHQCRSAIEAAGLEVLVLDQTRPDLRIPVAKVIVPGLRHFWARFAPGRLYDVPVSMGMLEVAHKEAELNPLPMFL